MKYILFLVFVLFSCEDTSTNESLSDVRVFLKIHDRMNEIVSYDTLNGDKKVVIGYDSDNNIVLRLETTAVSHKRLVYDQNNNIILERLESPKGTVVEEYEFDYNNKNQLIEKRGFSSGKLHHRTQYKYDPEGNLADELEYQGNSLDSSSVYE